MSMGTVCSNALLRRAPPASLRARGQRRLCILEHNPVWFPSRIPCFDMLYLRYVRPPQATLNA